MTGDPYRAEGDTLEDLPGPSLEDLLVDLLVLLAVPIRRGEGRSVKREGGRGWRGEEDGG